MSLIYLNNEFVEAEKAMLPVTDRGLRFGDGVFETIYFANNTIYQETLHKKRLKQSLEALRITGIDANRLFEQANALIIKNGQDSGSLRITITRGAHSLGYLPAENNQPNIFIETFAARKRSDTPLSLWISTLEKPRTKSLPVHAKTLNSLNSVMARMEAEDNNCQEAILLNPQGIICEGSSSNIFWFKNNMLYTPSLDCGILSGTIRDAVIRLSPYPVAEDKFTLENLIDAQEVFLTNVNLHAVPVGSIQPLDITLTSTRVSDKIHTLIQQDISADATAQVA